MTSSKNDSAESRRTFPSKEHHRYAAVGKCIYCGVTEEEAKLGEEHIVPYGLNGTLVLPASSCAECAKITGAQVERIVLKNMLLSLRTLRNIPTRRPKERPTKFPVAFDFGTHKTTTNVPIDDHPFIATLPIYDVALCLQGLPLGPLAQSSRFRIWQNVDFKDIAKKYGAVSATVASQFSVEMFNRMLAKIAHSYAVAEFGYGSFRPVLVSQILGTWGGPQNYYVGGGLDPLIPAAILHDLSLELRSIGRHHFIVARIRLFADLGAPTYYVVAGSVDAAQLPERRPIGHFQAAREDVVGPKIGHVGVYRVSAIHADAVVAGKHYYGFGCINCARLMPIFEDPSNGERGPITITGEGLIHVACPYCSASRSYKAKTMIRFKTSPEPA